MEFKQFHQPVGKDYPFQCLAKSSQICLFRGSRSHLPKHVTLQGAEGNCLPAVSDWHCFSLPQSESQKTMGRVAHLTTSLLCLFTANKLPKLYQPQESSSWITAMLVTGWHHIKKRGVKKKLTDSVPINNSLL